MTRRARVTAVVVFTGLVLVGLLLPGDEPLEASRTSYGTRASAYGAVYELLVALGYPVARSHASPARLPADASVWWIEPTSLCREAGSGGDASGESDWSVSLGAWVRGGGTAVVFLPPYRDCGREDRLAGTPLPERSDVELSDRGTDAGVPPRLGGPVTGRLVPATRRLAAAPLRTFRLDLDWWPLAHLDGEPFVVERALGAGRLVLVADPRFLANERLAARDASLLAVDLVHALGAPRFDEREHGLGPPRRVLPYLARSPALPLLVGLALLGALYAWSGTARPPRRLAESHASPPALESFVASLARLYAKTGDHPRVLEEYRHHSVARLKRALRLAPEVPLELLLARLRERRGQGEERLRLLTQPAEAGSRAALRARVRELDELVREVVS